MPISISDLNGHLYLSGVDLGVNPQTNTKRHVLKRDWMTCSTFVNFFLVQRST